MTYDPNLPPQLSEDSGFLNEEVRMQQCPECEGTGEEEYWESTEGGIKLIETGCYYCSGTGEIPMTSEEIREELENKKEKEYGIYNQ